MSKHKSEDYKLSAVKYYLNNDVSLDDLTPFGLLILSYHIAFISNRNRYNLSINNLEIIETHKLMHESKLVHNSNPEDNLENIYFDIYNCNLNLNENGYINYQKIHYEFIFNYNFNETMEKK